MEKTDMSDMKTIIKVWNDENYTQEQAKEDRALHTVEVKDFNTYGEEAAFIDGLERGLALAGLILANNKQAIKSEQTTLTAYRVVQDIVEVNRYSGTVWAENKEDLADKMKETDVIGHGDYELLEWGVSTSTENDGDWYVDKI